MDGTIIIIVVENEIRTIDAFAAKVAYHNCTLSHFS